MQAGGRDNAWSPEEGDGLPGARLVRTVQVLILFGVVVGVYLLIASPTLPNERERTSAAPPASTPQRGTGVSGQGQPQAPAASAPPQQSGAPATAPPAAGAAPTAEATPQGPRTHTVQPGDTLLAIAERYDTTVDAIRAANPGVDPAALRIGQELTIPPSR
jgi:LysM repeat protein